MWGSLCYYVARAVIKTWFYLPLPCFARQVVLCQPHFSNDTLWIILQAYFRLKVSKDCILFFSPFYKQQKQRSVIVFVSLFLCYVLFFDRLFSGLGRFSSHSLLLPSYATCHCWDYCCAYLVRCWILFMTLSCVPTVKRLIKHLYLPQIQNSPGSLLHWCLNHSACAHLASMVLLIHKIVKPTRWTVRPSVLGDIPGWRTGSCWVQSETVWWLKYRWGDPLQPAHRSAPSLMSPAPSAAVEKQTGETMG